MGCVFFWFVGLGLVVLQHVEIIFLKGVRRLEYF